MSFQLQFLPKHTAFFNSSHPQLSTIPLVVCFWKRNGMSIQLQFLPKHTAFFNSSHPQFSTTPRTADSAPTAPTAHKSKQPYCTCDPLETDKVLWFLSRHALAEIIQCAVKGVDVQRELIPPGNLLFPPVAIGAAVEVTKLSEPSMERVALATPRVKRP